MADRVAVVLHAPLLVARATGMVPVGQGNGQGRRVGPGSGGLETRAKFIGKSKDTTKRHFLVIMRRGLLLFRNTWIPSHQSKNGKRELKSESR